MWTTQKQWEHMSSLTSEYDYKPEERSLNIFTESLQGEEDAGLDLARHPVIIIPCEMGMHQASQVF